MQKALLWGRGGKLYTAQSQARVDFIVEPDDVCCLSGISCVIFTPIIIIMGGREMSLIEGRATGSLLIPLKFNRP